MTVCEAPWLPTPFTFSAEDHDLHNITYTLICQFYASRIKESLPQPQYRSMPSPKLQDWTDCELINIRRVLRRVASLRVESPEDAEDLVQETLLTMTLRRAEIDIRKGLLIWGMGILRNKLGNYYRRARRHDPFMESQVGATKKQSAVIPTQESALHYSELRALIDEIISKFEPHEQQVLQYFISGIPTHEIVQRLRPEKYQNIVNWLYRGRKKLARELSKYGYQGLTNRR